ncbi:hypothetical protein JCM5350_000194 [Sporobolomyces pararoseus]
MSFSSLPPELVHRIIESAVPHTFHTTTYWERQNTLRRLSLVSRRFRTIAQPLLLEIAWLDHNNSFKLSSGDGRKVGSHLVNLQLSGYDFNASSLDSIPSLQALSLNFQAAANTHELLDPRKIPALKALGLENIDESYELRDLESTRIDELLPQVDALCVEAELYQLAKHTLLLDLKPRTLVTFDDEQIQLSPTPESFSTLHHFRIDIHNLLTNLGRIEAIRVVLGFLQSGQQSKPRQLRSIYLDHEIQPIATDAEAVHGEFAQLEEECRAAGIDLVFESQGQDYNCDSYISPEFCRRQRKARERSQEVAEV